VKIRCFFRGIIIFLLAFINVIGGAVYSTNAPIWNLDPRNYDYFQEDQNTSTHLFEEISTGGLVQVVTKNDLTPGRDFISGRCICNQDFQNKTKRTSTIIRDQKEILTTYIFPFHFFW